MKYWNSDFIFIGVSAVTITAFSALLYADFNRKISVGTSNKVIGKITFKKKVAQRKYAQQVVWEDIEQNSTVFNNDSIRTSDISEAVINLEDGTAINIEENSLILLAAAKNAININFEQGSISASRSGVEGVLSKINIQSKDAIVSIDKSDVTLAKNDSDELDLSVSKGSAVVTSGGSEKTIEKDQKVIIDAATKETRIVETKFQLNEPAESSYVISLNDRTDIQFRWVEQKDVRPSIEVSTDRGFTKISAARDGVPGGALIPLAPGSYFWRLKAVNPQTKKYDYSEIRKFMILKDNAPVLAYPTNNEKIAFTVKPPLINFRWRKNELASSYFIEIATDQAFTKTVQRVQTPMNDLSFDSLQAGVYYWRVRTAVSIPGKASYSAVSQVHTFAINKNEVKQPPELMSPVDGIKISKNVISDKGVVFSWKQDRSVTGYEFELSGDPAFTAVIAKISVNGNFYQYKAPSSAGKLYWRVKGITGGGAEFLYSRQRIIDIIEVPAINLDSPANQTGFDLKEGENSQAVHFTWSESVIDSGSRYLFELAGDLNFTNIKKRQLLVKNSISIPGVPNGEYHWRVKLLDRDKNEITQSAINGFTIKEFIKPAVLPVAVKTEEVKPVIPEPEVKQPEKESAIIITSQVRGSAIYVDNKFSGYNKVTIKAEPDKNYEIRVKAPAHEESVQTVVVNKGETREIKPQLIQIRKLNRLKWKSSLKALPSTKAQLYKGLIYIGALDFSLRSLDMNGKLIWKKQLGGILKSNPAFTDDTIYAAGTDSNLYAVDRKTGEIKWKKKISSPLLFGAQPLVYDKKIYAATSSGMMHVFDEKGAELWKADLECGIFSSVIFSGSYIFIATDQYKIIAVDTGNGDVKWECPVKDRIVSASPVINDNYIYIGDMGGNFYKISIRKEKVLASIKLDSPVIISPVFFKDTAIIATEKGTVYSLTDDEKTRTFKENWKFDTKSPVKNDMNIIKESLIVTSGSTLYSVNIKTGALEWNFMTADIINTPVTVYEEDIILGLRNGDLVAIRYSIDVVKQ